ncbi:MAG: hypothetical protein FWF00_00940 [Endomicrobia bacterium]|nr:hypothetical protein [Endomicrobiia bacterium]MCL2506240.1 hypothetical protein [Endomicrobiia bacterium]
MKKILVLLLVMVFCTAGLYAAVKKPATIREKVSVSSANVIENAINKACAGKEWDIVKLDGHNVIFATVDTPKCVVTAKIVYTNQGYTIEYRESNLDFDDEEENEIINATFNAKIAQYLNSSILRNIKG